MWKWISGLLHPKEGKPLAVISINRKLNALLSFFSWGVREKRFSMNPMTDIQDVRTADEESENIMWLSEEEFEAYLDRMKKAPVKSRGGILARSLFDTGSENALVKYYTDVTLKKNNNYHLFTIKVKLTIILNIPLFTK